MIRQPLGAGMVLHIPELAMCQIDLDGHGPQLRQRFLRDDCGDANQSRGEQLERAVAQSAIAGVEKPLVDAHGPPIDVVRLMFSRQWRERFARSDSRAIEEAQRRNEK